MCSILGILDIQTDPRALRQLALRLSKRQRHRGPDWSGIHSGERAILAHERLAIVGVDTGAQPLYNPGRTHVLAVNGEIYNHQRLERELEQPFEFQTHSDCEVILALYAERGVRVGCFRPPSVPKGTSRLRLTARATLTDAELAYAGSVLAAVLSDVDER